MCADTFDVAREVVARATAGTFTRWHAQVQATGFCAQPIRLSGAGRRIDTDTGKITGDYTTDAEPDGVLLVACGTRRAALCPPCSATYRADTYQLVATGVRGGKTIPSTVAEHPAVFATFTAPSFGLVHTARGTARRHRPCHPPRKGEWQWCEHGQPVVCTRVHARDDDIIGAPLCEQCYDTVGIVLFNALAPELWRRTTVYLPRLLAARAGLTYAELRRQLRVSFTKVAEYQRRGVIHFHAVIRLDGPDGPEDLPPAWADPKLLRHAIRGTAAAVRVAAPDVGDGVTRVLRWGEQLDIRTIRRGAATQPARVAAYLAKYATKASEGLTGGLAHRIRSVSEIDGYSMPAHIRRLVRTCWSLGDNRKLGSLKLRRWAHMLGFGGHYATRSRRYSLTLRSLREARAHWRLRHGGRHVVDGTWRYVGRGHTTPGDSALVAAAATTRQHAAEAARAQRRAEQALLAEVA
jgi:hypothetical protein